MVRHELNYGPAEWAALPWHHQRNFVEKLVERGLLVGGADSDEPSAFDLAASGADVDLAELDDDLNPAG